MNPRAGEPEGMTISKVTYDGQTITVVWQSYPKSESETNPTGFLVTIELPYSRLDNFLVDGPTATQADIGYVLQAGVQYRCWITPVKPPGFPDDANASTPVPIPYSRT